MAKFVVIEFEKLSEAIAKINDARAASSLVNDLETKAELREARLALVPRDVDFREVITKLCEEQGREVEIGENKVTIPAFDITKIDRRLFGAQEPQRAFVEKDNVIFDEEWIGPHGRSRTFVSFDRFNGYHDADGKWEQRPKTESNTNLAGGGGIPAGYGTKTVTAIELEVMEGSFQGPLEVGLFFAARQVPVVTFSIDKPGRYELKDGTWLSGKPQSSIDIIPLEQFMVAIDDAKQQARVRVKLHGPLISPVRDGEEPLPFEPMPTMPTMPIAGGPVVALKIASHGLEGMFLPTFSGELAPAPPDLVLAEVPIPTFRLKIDAETLEMREVALLARTAAFMASQTIGAEACGGLEFDPTKLIGGIDFPSGNSATFELERVVEPKP